MKRILTALVLVVSVTSGPLFAQNMLDNLGQVHFTAGFGVKSITVPNVTLPVSAVPLYAGAEVGLVTLPAYINLGLRVLGAFSNYSYTGYSTVTVTAVAPSALLGIHWGLKSLKTGISILDGFDVFGGIGVGVSLSSWVSGGSSGTNDPKVDVAYSVGVAYYPDIPSVPFLKHIGVTAEFSSYAGLGMGVVFKLR